MNHVIHNNIVNFIWGIADDVLRDVYVRVIEVLEVAEDELLPLEEDDAATAEMMDSEEDMDEND